MEDLPKLPVGFEWHIKKAYTGGYILALIPAEGYIWDFPLAGSSYTRETVFYYTHLSNVKDKDSLEVAAKQVLSESLGPTTVVKPKIRRTDV